MLRKAPEQPGTQRWIFFTTALALLTIISHTFRVSGMAILYIAWLVHLYRLAGRGSSENAFLARISIILVMAYPFVFKLFYEHHLMFSISGCLLMLFLQVGSLRAARLLNWFSLLLLAAAMVLLNCPKLMIRETWVLDSSAGLPDTILLATVKFTTIGVVVFGLAAHLWLKLACTTDKASTEPVSATAAGGT
jgi:hypothetical protein